MEIMLLIKTENYQKVKDLLLKDEVVSRASIVFKDAEITGKEGYYCWVSGLETQCKKALELVKQKDEETGETIELAKEVGEEEKEEVISKIKEEESKAIEGFGSIIS